MPIQIGGAVGPQTKAPTSGATLRQGFQGDLTISELHGRFYEQAYAGSLFCGGISNMALAANNAIVTTLGATALPVVGVYNPQSSTVNLVVLQAIIVTTTVGNTAVAPGGFMWVGSGNNAISTGTLGVNRKTLGTNNGQGKFFNGTTAVTGLTNTLVALAASGIATINAAGPATAITQPQSNVVENVDGSWVVPPGGVLGLMNQVSTVSISVSTSIVWEEVPI